MSGTIDQRIEELALNIPEPAAPVASVAHIGLGANPKIAGHALEPGDLERVRAEFERLAAPVVARPPPQSLQAQAQAAIPPGGVAEVIEVIRTGGPIQ